MACKRCGATIHTDEQAMVEESFDLPENLPLCWTCAVIRHHDKKHIDHLPECQQCGNVQSECYCTTF